ncbi:FecCD family ABC transporter permease [Terribacillus saccharophilus]|uniref:FecCD family ABC transporter permease n=1 Tax=Terribacillus saccharophilus TaxID=361277 RepID=UPI003D26D1F1
MKKSIISFVTVSVLLIITIVYSAITGSIKVGAWDFVTNLFSSSNEQVEIVKDLRLPRIIVSLFSGAALALSGALLQSVLRNPLADAGVIGVSSGASFFSLLLVTLLPQYFFWTPLFAFIGGTVSCFLIYLLSWRSGLHPIRILLIGIAINAMFVGLTQAFITVCSYLGKIPDQSTSSNLSMRTWDDVQIVTTYGLIGIILAFFLYPWCNMLLLQDKTARNLGLNVGMARIVISGVAVLLAAIATAVGGVIAFIGLLIPHISRNIVGTDHRLLLPFSALSGALLILLADTFGRTIIAPSEIPASTIMAIIGGPFLIFLLKRSDKVHAD